MNWRPAILFGLLMFSCAPPAPTPVPSPSEPEPPFGDAIDDAAWEALGPRPVEAPRLPFGGAMRLHDFWLVDPVQRTSRTSRAAMWTYKADSLRTRHGIDRLDLYLDAIRLAPLFLPAWAPACLVLTNRGEVDRAAALARQYARLAPPGDGMPQYILGKCEARQGNLETALAFLQQAAASPTTTETDVLTALALVYLQLGNLNAAESLQTVYDLHEPSLHLLIRSRRARQEGDLQGAATLLQETTTTPGAPTGVWEELASARLALGEFEAARQAYEKALQQTPQRSAPRLGLARVAQAQGDHASALAILQEVLQESPANLSARFNQAAVLLDRARQSDPTSQASLDDLEHARQSWSICIDQKFNTQAALWGRAETNLRRHDLSAAQFDAVQLHEISDDIPATQTHWAQLLMVTGYHAEALEALREASTHDELDHRGRALLAQLEDRAGTDALPLLRNAFLENPQDSALGTRLGIGLLNAGEFEEAEEVLRAVVQLRPSDPNAYQNLAAVLDRRKKYREAQAALQKAESLR